MKVYAVIPAYNEAATVGQIVKIAKKYCTVLVVDDGSKDETAAVAKKSGAEVVRHATNMGYGRGLRDGISAALERGADAIITLDADGQHDPNDIPKFIDALNKGSAGVVGSRFLTGNSWGTWKRMLALRLLAIQLRVFTGIEMTDVQSGFRAYSAEMLRSIKLSEEGMAFSVELPIKAKRLEYQFTEVPIQIKQPHRIKTFWSAMKQGIEVGKAIIRYAL